MQRILFLYRLIAWGMLVILAPQTCQAQIIINEVFWSGSDLSTADEWLEIHNTGTGAVEMAGWNVTSLNSRGLEVPIARFATGTVVAPDQYYLISNYPASASRLSGPPDLVTTGLSLPNSKLLLRLRDATGRVVDQADDGVGLPMAGRNDSGIWGKASMERLDPPGPGDQPGSWRTASTFIGFDDGSRLYGTPGYLNGSGDTADHTPPQEAQGLDGTVQVSLTGATLTLHWQPSASLDLWQQQLTLEGGFTGSLILSPTSRTAQWAVPSSASGYSIRLVSVDDLGNRSAGVPLHLIQNLNTNSDQNKNLNKGTIRISEMMPNPVGSDANEWLEFINTGTGAETLTGYTLTVGTKTVSLVRLTLSVASGAYAVAPASAVSLTLPNAGGTVVLAFSGRSIQQFVLPELPEGIAFGLLGTGSTLQPICSPTPGSANLLLPPSPQLVLQSGNLQGEGKATANLQILATTGSLAGARCTVDYADGTLSQSCNPPSHTFRRIGPSVITATITDYCGTTVQRTVNVDVQPQGSVRRRNPVPTPVCQPSASSGVNISEVLPHPLSGDQEWVELQNRTDEEVNLCGWQLDDEDGGSAPFHLDGLTILARSFVSLDHKRTKISLNNTGDQVRLVAPGKRVTATGTWLTHSGGFVLQTIAIPSGPEGESFAVNDQGSFLWTPIPTPGSQNVFPEALSPIASQSVDLVATPNPSGQDGMDGEELGLGVTGPEAVDMTGWQLSDQGGAHQFTLDMTVLAPGDYRWFKGRETGIPLANAHGLLELRDRAHRLVTVLAWTSAREGQVLHSFLTGERQPIDVLHVAPDGRALVRPFVWHRSELLAVPEEVQRFMGLENTSPLWMKYMEQEIRESHSYNKKYEYYSRTVLQNGSGSLLLLRDGELAIYRLLRLGLVPVSEQLERSSLGETALAYEADAQAAKRGLWADDQRVKQILAERQERHVRDTIAAQGLRVILSPEPGLVAMTGTTVKIHTNVPASILVSTDTGAFMASSGSVQLERDTLLRVQAQLQLGKQLVTASASGHYVLRRKDYRHTIELSEVYPAPTKAMDAVLGWLNQEWVEVRNMTSVPQNLAGWQLDDAPAAGSRARILPSSFVVPPHGYLVLPHSVTKLSYSNRGDSVILQDPNGNMEQIMYSNMHSGQSVVIKHGRTCLSDAPTPGRDGRCVLLSRGKDAKDSDGDSLSDDAELYLYGTNPASADSNGDGWPDGLEVYARTHSGALNTQYEKYLLSVLKPSWHRTRTRGLVVQLGKGPLLSARYTIDGTPLSGSLSLQKTGVWRTSIAGTLKPGTYDVTIIATDILSKKVVLKNAMKIKVNENYTYYKKQRSSAAAHVSARYRYPTADKDIRSSVLDRLRSYEAQDNRNLSGWVILVVTGVSLCLGFLILWHWRQRKNQLSE